MTEREQALINLINDTKAEIAKQYVLLEKWQNELGYDRYKEILIEQFQKDLDEFIESFPENKIKADFWYNDNYNEYCCSFNFDEDNFSDDDYDKLCEFESEDRVDLVLFTTNHRLF